MCTSTSTVFTDIRSVVVSVPLPHLLLQLLLLTIRVMDDVKDYDKDVIVHPER